MPVRSPSRTPYRPRYRKRQKRRFPLPVLLFALAACALVCALLLYFRRTGKAKTPYYKGEAPWRIGLDAGHGGSDPGAQGLVSELDMTEQTVRALQTLLENDDNFIPVLCRGWDETVSRPSLRAIEGNRKKADLLLSVHGNSSGDADAHGFECFPIPPGRELAAPSLELAGHLAAAFSDAGASLRGIGGVRYVYYEGENEDVKTFHESTDTAVYDFPTFGFLEYAESPAVLVEQGFVTNAGDVALFGGETGAANAARCIYRAICAYYGIEPKL